MSCLRCAALWPSQPSWKGHMAVFGMTTEKSKNSASENFFQFFSFSRDLNLHIGDRYVEYPDVLPDIAHLL
jgi:hypothetical protein